MEEINEVDDSLINFSKIEIFDIFPQNILYPNQNPAILKPVEKNTNTNIIQTNMNVNQNNSNNIRIIDEPDNKHKKHKTDQMIIDTSDTLSINKKYKTVCFSDFKVYDIFIRGNVLIACGGKYIKIYNSKTTKQTGSIPCDADYTFYDKEENFYTISYSEIIAGINEKIPIIAAGGIRSIIRVINLLDGSEIGQLIGHRNEIYDLKFHPLIGHLLLSASKDFSIRLWNVLTQTQICIFGGPHAHSAEVLAIDWHMSGNYFISGGIDTFIKIWEIDERVRSNIILSEKIISKEVKKEKKFKTIIKTLAKFSCNSVHDNYVDCIRFNGNLVISKSIDGVIKEWLPQFNKEGDHFMLVNTYPFHEKEFIWYMKFGVDIRKGLIGAGNSKGQFFLFKINEETNDENMSGEFDYAFTVDPIGKISTDKSLIRCVHFDSSSNQIALGNNTGYIHILQLV